MDLATVREAPPTTQKQPHYLLAGAHCGEGAERDGVRMDVDGLLMSAEFSTVP
jgi:hypothetical protein